MTSDSETYMVYKAAPDLVCKCLEQPNNYTEQLLHAWRLKIKAARDHTKSREDERRLQAT